MATIRVRQDIPNEVAVKMALSQLKKKTEEEGILKDLRKREFYIKPSVARKLKSINARKLAKKKVRKFRDDK